MTTEYKIKELDLNTLKPIDIDDKDGAKYVFIGKPGMGKSQALLQLLYSKKHIIPVGQVYSGSELYDPFYSKYFHELVIHYDFDFTVPNLERFQQRQLLAKRNINNPWAVQIVDDSTSDKKIFNRPIVQNYYKNGRHWKMMHLLATQHVFDLPTTIRTCIDGTFIMKEISEENRMKIWKNFSSVIPKKDFNDFMDQLTEDYHCIFVKNNSTSKRLDELVFSFKADPTIIPPDWKFGSEAFWDVCNIRFNKDYQPPTQVLEDKKRK